MHELGHIIGLTDVVTATHPQDIMADTLPTGVRRLPANLLGGQIGNLSYPSTSVLLALSQPGQLAEAVFGVARLPLAALSTTQSQANGSAAGTMVGDRALSAPELVDDAFRIVDRKLTVDDEDDLFNFLAWNRIAGPRRP